MCIRHLLLSYCGQKVAFPLILLMALLSTGKLSFYLDHFPL